MSFSYELAIGQVVAPIAGLTEQQIAESLETPKNKAMGDFALPVAKLNRFKKLQGNPAQIATEWSGRIPLNDVVRAVSPAGPYINFVVNKSIMLQRVVPAVLAAGERFGCDTEGEGKTVIVEFSSPNIAKPFHAGHLRSTIIGNFLKNLFKTLGYNTLAINYLGDWGKQYGLLAVGFQRFGNEEALRNCPIKHLFDVYVAINKAAEAEPTIHDEARAMFRQMETGDATALGIWRKFRDLSIDEYKKIYARLNVHFDIYSGESQMTAGMEEAMRLLEQKNLLSTDKGATLVNLDQFKLPGPLVRKSDGATLYITRDIAAAAERHVQFNFEHMFYIVAAQQDLHFQQLFAILKLMDYPWAERCHHINFGMVRGMSTRKGNVVFLEDILEHTKEYMLEVMKKNEEKFAEVSDPETVADIVGLSAVVIQDLSAKRIKDYDFDMARMTNSEGDTGPYLQYMHARLCSIERKTGVVANPNANLALLVEPEAEELARQISYYPDVIKQCKVTLEPCTLVTYLFQLAHAISTAYSKLWVVNQEPPIAEARMTLYQAARIVLGNALKILGLIPLERM